jgi:hypothetical protein
LPAPPKFMGECQKPARPQVGDDPKVAYLRSDVALDDCSRRGQQSRAWYLGMRKRYSGR